MHIHREDPKTAKCLTPETITTEFARTLPSEHIESMLRTLARRPAGREAILNSPTVVRAITQSSREAKRTVGSQRGKQLAELSSKISQAKGCATKANKKLSRVEAHNKGLRTMLATVV